MKLDARDIHAIANDISEHQRPADFEAFYRKLRDGELLVPVQPRPGFTPPASGAQLNLRSDQVIFGQAVFPDGRKFAIFYLDSNDERLPVPFIAISAHDAFRMTMNRGDVTGLIIQCRGDVAFTLEKPMVERMLNEFLA